ncbi:RNA-directed RNA polymerase [Coprinopsis sp. MPI-PUGE-AT-0042]|nr:RNA-directed RNA polymerase [Coprinopsis sp. MPI-PUGE-AT-0042]
MALGTAAALSQRVIHADDPAKFILLGLDRSFRFPDHPPRSRVEYLNRMFKAGVFLNGVQYRFYHHSNSQLRGRSCFLRQAATDQELDHLIYAMGDFGRINNVAKRAKRIGLLFSSAEIDFQLDPTHIEDIPDIEFGGEVFSDGCGLISKALAVRIAKAKGLVFRGTRYTPVVIQIRYLGYKGVLMIHPDLDSRNRQREEGTPPCHAQFRKSMKKFNATSDNSFSVVGYSKPYSFGRLNNDIITLLHSLGVTTEKLLARQQAYFDWIAKAIEFDDDPTPAIDFLSCLEKHQKAEQVLLRDGESSPKLLKEIRDCLKLRAVDHPQLSHLVDCVVFASQARKPGNKPAPSMTSGGDLDGDEFFVCWDPDLVPPKISEPKNVTRADLANHFAAYNSSGVAKVSLLHNKWAISSPLGALCVECQELNVLHSQSVDGAPIKVPDRLQNPPEPTEPFIIDVLRNHEEEFEANFRALPDVDPRDLVDLTADDAQRHVGQLFKGNQSALSEYELFELALRLSRKHKFDLKPYLAQLDVSALTSMQKSIIKTTLDLAKIDYPFIWNSLFQSDILSAEDLRLRGFDSSISLQKLYSSSTSSQATFFEYLQRATQDYTRKLLLLKLYNNNIGDTFVFIGRSPSEHQSDVVMSIALGKFSASVQRQLGRLNRAPLKDIELHVVSNHDRVAQQLFDLWYSHVPTEEYIPRFGRQLEPPAPNSEEFQGEELEQARKQCCHQIDLDAIIPSILFTAGCWTLLCTLPSSIMQKRNRSWSFMIRSRGNHFLPTSSPSGWRGTHSSLSPSFDVLPPTDDLCLDEPIIHLATNIIRAIVRSANETRIAALVALEKLACNYRPALSTRDYFNILMLVALSVRSHNLAREVLLVLHESRLNQRPQPLSPSDRYMHKHSLNIVVDRAEEAGDECPCNDDGQPRKQRTPPAQVKLSFVDSNHTLVKAAIRLDARTNARLHSHVRLKATSKAENKWLTLPMNRGEMVIELKQPAPPELERMDWVIYDAGGTSTANAEMDALSKLIIEGYTCCAFYHLITGDTPMHAPSTDSGIEPPSTGESHKDQDEGLIDEEEEGSDDGNNFEEPSEIVLPNAAQLGLNPSQFQAVASWSAPLSLIWGPPAVDNVLERFLVINAAESLLPEDRILRVATDQSRVGTALLPYTIDDRVGGDVNQNRKRMKEAARRVKQARLVFSTCAVKGAKKAIMVGDHVQLRPTVRKMGKVLESDISLLERLYTGEDVEGIQKTMLDVQYRSPQVLNAFPSQEFYNDKLQTAEQNEGKLTLIENLLFPWPKKNGAIAPAVFVPCSVEEDQGGGRSKSNEGQVEVVRRVVQLLAADPEKPPLVKPLDITVLSPYKGQIQKLRHRLPSSVPVSTVDAFQGRESDIIIFSTVRCNAHRESSIDAIGFLDDPRRLNVMWTRARLALIIVGDRSTLSENSPLWKRALNACQEVSVEVED